MRGNDNMAGTNQIQFNGAVNVLNVDETVIGKSKNITGELQKHQSGFLE